MGNHESVLESLAEMDRHIARMAAAEGIAEIVEEAGAYLSSWTPDRVRSLQTVDGGWAPFDEQQSPTPIHCVDQILRLADVIHAQRDALAGSGIAVTPEMLELDVFFFLARQLIEDRQPARVRPAPGMRRHAGYRHWNDGATRPSLRA